MPHSNGHTSKCLLGLSGNPVRFELKQLPFEHRFLYPCRSRACAVRTFFEGESAPNKFLLCFRLMDAGYSLALFETTRATGKAIFLRI